MEDKKNIDELVIRRAQKQSELAAIHREIHESQRQATIIIVDLVGSTALKQKAEDADWLGLVSALRPATRRASPPTSRI